MPQKQKLSLEEKVEIHTGLSRRNNQQERGRP